METKINILEGVEEYYQNQSLLENMFDNLPTKEINGLVYKILDCTLEEFIDKTKAVRLEDIKWTQVNEVITKSDD